jgi:hypothetical protein
MIDWTVGPFSVSWLLAYYESPWSFEETVARIITASGQPPKSGDDYKVSVEFEGRFKGQRFTLYDYKEGRSIHIGGNDKLDVVGLVAQLTFDLDAVRPTPYRAKEYYCDKEGHGFDFNGA